MNTDPQQNIQKILCVFKTCGEFSFSLNGPCRTKLRSSQLRSLYVIAARQNDSSSTTRKYLHAQLPGERALVVLLFGRTACQFICFFPANMSCSVGNKLAYVLLTHDHKRLFWWQPVTLFVLSSVEVKVARHKNAIRSHNPSFELNGLLLPLPSISV